MVNSTDLIRSINFFEDRTSNSDIYFTFRLCSEGDNPILDAYDLGEGGTVSIDTAQGFLAKNYLIFSEDEWIFKDSSSLYLDDWRGKKFSYDRRSIKRWYDFTSTIRFDVSYRDSNNIVYWDHYYYFPNTEILWTSTPPEFKYAGPADIQNFPNQGKGEYSINQSSDQIIEGTSLNIKRDIEDPDFRYDFIENEFEFYKKKGISGLTYKWQSSSDNIIWSEIGNKSLKNYLLFC